MRSALAPPRSPSLPPRTRTHTHTPDTHTHHPPTLPFPQRLRNFLWILSAWPADSLLASAWFALSAASRLRRREADPAVVP
jgi:hypothetical protein